MTMAGAARPHRPEGVEMSFFRKPAARDSQDIATVKGLEDRDRAGPLPIGDDADIMARRLAAERQRALSGGSGCCVAVCLPDPMQGLTAGEAAGETATRFANSLRAYDAIFRYGENRILACMPFVKAADAPNVMARLRDLASRMPVTLPDGTSGHIMVSVGSAMMERSADVQETIRRAEKAMEQGRLSGNRICLWTPDML